MAALPTGIAATPGSNRFSRITKASAAVRLILVRSRRSDGRREEWSGLSESNRHLNLGKVPYYHYTKAAQPLSFYSMAGQQRQALPAFATARPNTIRERSGHLCDTGRLYHRRTALPLREARGFALVRIHAAELFSIRVINAYEEMMVLAAAVRAESRFPFFRVLFFGGFCHCDHPSLWKIRQHYLKESSAAQVPGKIVMRASLQQKNVKT